MSDLHKTNEQVANKDDVIAQLERECDRLRAALDGARRELFLVQARHESDARRAKYNQRMGWHSDFDPHDMSKLAIVVDPDCGQKTALPVSALESRWARRVFRKLHVKLRKLSLPTDMPARRKLIADAYQKIAAMRSAPRWRRLLAFF